ncbi:MAG: hypothetical protein HQL80_05700 [Magnetococcales bacterium]|nr:hypothetical protein [Magnetococcales bacterium]
MQIDDEFLPITEIARMWAVESPNMPESEILKRLWVAFWKGEFEGKFFIFQPDGRIGEITDERLYFYRDQLFYILKKMAGLRVEPIQGDGYGQEKIDGQWYYHNPGDAAYKKLILNLDLFYSNLHKGMKEVYVDDAMLEGSDLIAWCHARSISPPSSFFMPTGTDTAGTEKAVVFAGRTPNADRALIEAEMKRRAEAGEMLPTITQEAKYLAEWAITAVPNGVHSKEGTIKNNLRDLYKSLKPAKT